MSKPLSPTERAIAEIADSNRVYYKIYRWEKIDWKLTVVCMQWFDESDYYQDRFFTDEDGNVLEFDSKQEAIDWLLENIKPEMIDPEYLEKSSKFSRQSYLK